MTGDGAGATGRREAGWRRRGLAWGVHLLTASGGVMAVAALLATAAGDLRAGALWMLAAMTVDAVDGTLARRVGVAEVLPGIDGRRLDDVIDYLNFVVVPAFFMVQAGALPSPLWAALPVLASAYGFAQVDAKTEDDFFLGFPSYWNVVAVYLWKLAVPPPFAAAIVLAFAVAVFVPLKYVYPSKTRVLPRLTNAGAGVWTAVVALAVAFPERLAGLPLIELSLLYPAYYLGLSWFAGGMAGDTRSRR